jgi:hypothetical protein
MKFAHAPAALLAVFLLTGLAPAQPKGPKGPVFVSPEVKADRSVVFRINAPKAEDVRLSAGDIPGGGGPRALKKGDNGVWELTLEKVAPGTYR